MCNLWDAWFWHNVFFRVYFLQNISASCATYSKSRQKAKNWLCHPVKANFMSFADREGKKKGFVDKIILVENIQLQIYFFKKSWLEFVPQSGLTLRNTRICSQLTNFTVNLRQKKVLIFFINCLKKWNFNFKKMIVQICIQQKLSWILTAFSLHLKSENSDKRHFNQNFVPWEQIQAFDSLSIWIPLCPSRQIHPTSKWPSWRERTNCQLKYAHTGICQSLEIIVLFYQLGRKG